MLPIRAPVVAGKFYDIDPKRLKKQLSVCFSKVEDTAKKIKAQHRELRVAVVPHAGYEYSGSVAARVYSMISEDSPKNYIILGTNHSGYGSRFATMKRGLWKTPLGGIVVNTSMVNKLLEECKLLENDFMPHQNEHSIEVQLPFLQYKLGNDFEFVPISVTNEEADETLLESCRMLGKSIAKVVKKDKDKWIVLASSDFSHYVPQKFAEEVDNYLIRAIVRLNEKTFFSRIAERNASACGFGSIAVAMVIAKELGSKRGKLLEYATSADVTGDTGAVVGYASILL